MKVAKVSVQNFIEESWKLFDLKAKKRYPVLSVLR